MGRMNRADALNTVLTWLAAAAIVVLFGIVSQLDYEDQMSALCREQGKVYDSVADMCH